MECIINYLVFTLFRCVDSTRDCKDKDSVGPVELPEITEGASNQDEVLPVEDAQPTEAIEETPATSAPQENESVEEGNVKSEAEGDLNIFYDDHPAINIRIDDQTDFVRQATQDTADNTDENVNEQSSVASGTEQESGKRYVQGISNSLQSLGNAVSNLQTVKLVTGTINGTVDRIKNSPPVKYGQEVVQTIVNSAPAKAINQTLQTGADAIKKTTSQVSQGVQSGLNAVKQDVSNILSFNRDQSNTSTEKAEK